MTPSCCCATPCARTTPPRPTFTRPGWALTRSRPTSTIIGSNPHFRDISYTEIRDFLQPLRRQRHRRPPAQRLAAGPGPAPRLGHLRRAAAAVRAERRHPGQMLRAAIARAQGPEGRRRGARAAGQSADLRRRLLRPDRDAGADRPVRQPTTCGRSCAWPANSTPPVRRGAPWCCWAAPRKKSRRPSTCRPSRWPRAWAAASIEHEIYLVAIGRMAKTSVKLAVLALNKVASRLSAQEQAQGWANIALQSSYTLAPETRGYWRKSAGAPLSIDALQWKTRYALRDGDWREVEGRHPRHAGHAAQRPGLDLLAGPRADGRDGAAGPTGAGQRRRAAAVPQHRRPVEFLRPAGAGRNRPPDHDPAGRRADRRRPKSRPSPPTPASSAR